MDRSWKQLQDTCNSSKRSAPEVDLEYPNELHELHNYYRLAPDRKEIKRKILSECQLKITDLYNIPIGNIKKLMPNFLIKRSMCFIRRTYNFTRDQD